MLRSLRGGDVRVCECVSVYMPLSVCMCVCVCVCVYQAGEKTRGSHDDEYAHICTHTHEHTFTLIH